MQCTLKIFNAFRSAFREFKAKLNSYFDNVNHELIDDPKYLEGKIEIPKMDLSITIILDIKQLLNGDIHRGYSIFGWVGFPKSDVANLDNYFDFHVCLSIRPWFRASVVPCICVSEN